MKTSNNKLSKPVAVTKKKKNLSEHDAATIPNGENFKLGLVVAEWNPEITFSLRDGCIDTLKKYGVKETDIELLYVPGTFEIPAGARILLGATDVDAVIGLGCVIKGDTNHNEYINQAVAHGLTQLSISSGKPMIFGVLTPNNMEQAYDRAGGKYGNKGVEAAITALKMVALKKSFKSAKKSIGFSQ